MKIDKGIPYDGPARGAGHAGKKGPKYPFGDMEVGDSFLQVWEEGTDSEQIRKMQTRLTVSSHAHRPKTFATKIRKEEGGVRVWRVS